MIIEILEATQSDAEALSAIHQECFPTYWNKNEFNNFFDVDGTQAWLAEIVPSDLCLVPEKSNKNPITRPQAQGTHYAGMVVYRAQFEQADIITLAVLPNCRRRGIAKALVEKALSRLAGLGVHKVFLDVEDGNIAALRLYESFGFAVQRRRKLYYRQKDGSYTDALVMKKKIA